MLRLNNRIVPLLPLTSTKTTVLKNSSFRISSVLVSNSLNNNSTKLFSLKGNNNTILTRLRYQSQQPFFKVKKDATRQLLTFGLSKSLMNFRNSFRDSFATLRSQKNRFTSDSKKNSNNSTTFSSAPSSTKDSSSKTASEETTNIEEGRSLTEKFKILTKKYGISAIAVYLVISVVDLGLTLILIQIGGADRVKKIEDWFANTFGDWIILRKNPPKKEENNQQDIVIKISTPPTKTDNTESDIGEFVLVNGDNKSKNTPSWASTLVIAYGIHKLLVPLRLGLTVAITPALARKLKRMGWNIGGKHL